MFTPNSGDFSQKGKYYEQNVTAFISLKALAHLDNFRLLNHLPDCAPYDDIILITKKGDVTTVHLFQVKYKFKLDYILDADFVGDCKKSKFHLETLYEKYPKAKSEIENIISAKRCNFGIKIFTNRPIKEDTELFISIEDIFTTTSGKAYRFKDEFLESEVGPEKRLFLQSIILYADQTEGNMKNTSICDIQKYFKLEEHLKSKEEDTWETTNSEYSNCIKNWCEMQDTKASLTKNFIDKLLLYAMFKKFAVPMEKYEEKAYQKYQQIVRGGCLDSLWKTIKDQSLNISNEHIQYVLGKSLEDFKSFDNENKQYEEIIATDELNLKTNKTQLKYNVGCLLGELPFIVQNFPISENFEYSKVVFVNEDNLRGKLSKISDDALNDLKQQIITTSSGQKFKVEDIIGGLLDETSISDILSVIFRSHTENINKNKMFVNRKLKKVLLDPKIFSTEEKMTNERFIIITSENNEFIENLKINKETVFIVNNHRVRPLDFKTIGNYKYILVLNTDAINIQQRPNWLNVHVVKLLIIYRRYQVEWIRSHGTTENINKFRINTLCEKTKEEIDKKIIAYYNCKCCVKFNEFRKYFQNSFKVITGIPGMGKTTFLKQLAQSAPCNEFVLLITLTNHYDYFEKNKKKYINSAFEHLNYFCKNECKILTESFVNKLRGKKLVILLDGFDEIAPNYTKVVSNIISQIREESYQVILTTRCVLKDKIETIFGTFAISLSRFNYTEQESFLEIYFPKKTDTKQTIEYSKFKNIVMNNRYHNIEFYNVPFNLQLISELILSEIKAGKDVQINYQINVLDLYQKFIINKLDTYIKKTNNPNINESLIDTYHKCFAISELFNKLPQYKNINQALTAVLKRDSFDLKIGGEKVGILIDDLNEIFIHRTVAEYYAAKWLFDIIHPPTDAYECFCGEEKFASYIKREIYSPEVSNNKTINFSVIKSFLELMIINQNELHKAAYKCNYNFIKKTDKTNLNCLNIMNRTLLYTIIFRNPSIYDSETYQINFELIEIIKMLIENYPNMLTEKDSFGICAQNYVEQMKSNLPLKMFIHKNIVCCNRYFELWEIFRFENLFKCDIHQLLNALQTSQQLLTIFQAARNGNFPVIQLFYESGINLNIKSHDNIHLLHLAAAGGSLKIIKFLVDDGMKEQIKSKDIRDRSLMHYAVLSENFDLISYLKENNLNIEAFDRNGLSAFHYAVIFNKINIVKKLLKEDSYLNFCSKYGYIPIHYAVAFCNQEMYKLLTSNKANMEGNRSIQCIHSETLINFISFTNSFFKTEFDRIIKENIQIFGDNNKTNIKLFKIRNNYYKRCSEFVKFLLTKCENNINSYDNKGNTPLIMATFYENKKMIKLLLENSADINCANYNGCTPLHVAASKCNIEILRLIFNNNIKDINAQDKSGNTALHYALNVNNCFETVDFLIKNGVKPNGANHDGITPLHLAVQEEHFEALQLLVGQPETNINSINNEGETALHYAVYVNNINIVKYLIEMDAKVNSWNSKKQTALDIANKLGYKEIGSYLANNNGTSNGKDCVDWRVPSPLDLFDRTKPYWYGIRFIPVGFFEFYLENSDPKLKILIRSRTLSGRE